MKEPCCPFKTFLGGKKDRLHEENIFGNLKHHPDPEMGKRRSRKIFGEDTWSNIPINHTMHIFRLK